jgi:hypothetical protein
VAPDTPPVDLLTGITPALEPDFRLDNLIALSRERALYRAWDRRLKRSVALRVHLIPESPGRAWFLRENETLAALNHPAVRHVYASGKSARSPTAPPTGSTEKAWPRRCGGDRARFPA